MTVSVTQRAWALIRNFKPGLRGRMISEAVIMFLEAGIAEALAELRTISLQLQQLIELLNTDDQIKGGQKWKLIGESSEILTKLKKLLP